VVEEVRQEVEVDSVLGVVVQVVEVAFREVEVEVSRRGGEVHPEEADLEEDGARLGVICGNFASGVRLLCTKITAVV